MILYHILSLTSDDDGGSSFYVFTHTAVRATVLRLAFPDEELQCGAALLHLVFLSTGQHMVSFLPLRWSIRFGELTGEGQPVALLDLNIFQFLKEFDGPF